MRLIAKFLIFLNLALGVSCTSTKDKASKTEKEVKLSKEEEQKLDDARLEIQLGRNMAGRLLQYYGHYDNEELIKYVNEVGLYVSANSDFPDGRYMFDILNTEEINAFACPGGYILISKGALRHAENEAELAHVLAHEVAHVGKKHMYDTLKSMTPEEMEKTTDAAEKKYGFDPDKEVRKRPDPEQSEVGSAVAKYLVGSNASFNVLGAAKAGMSLILEDGLGAEKEYEADRLGTRFAVDSGYDPMALENYLCRIEAKRGGSFKKCLRGSKNKKKSAKDDVIKAPMDKTHPSIAMRIKVINKELTKLDAKEIVGAKGTKRYKRFKRTIPSQKVRM